jgi:hypothetical protein
MRAGRLAFYPAAVNELWEAREGMSQGAESECKDETAHGMRNERRRHWGARVGWDREKREG